LFCSSLQKEGITALIFVSKKRIEIDDEVTLDYNWNYSDFQKLTNCLCGEESCRKTIEKVTSRHVASVDATFSSLEIPRKAGIYNCDITVGTICYFSAAVQFLFRGVSFDKVKQICNDTVARAGRDAVLSNDVLDAELSNDVLICVKNILIGNYVPYSRDLHVLALCSNEPSYFTTHRNVSDASFQNLPLLDCEHSVNNFALLLFVRYVGFAIHLLLIEEPEIKETVTSAKKKKTVTKTIPRCNIVKYDLSVEFEKHFTRKDQCIFFNKIQCRLGSYFIVYPCRDESLIDKKSLTNVLGFEVKGSADETCTGYALLKAYVYRCNHHFTAYVLDW